MRERILSIFNILILICSAVIAALLYRNYNNLKIQLETLNLQAQSYSSDIASFTDENQTVKTDYEQLQTDYDFAIDESANQIGIFSDNIKVCIDLRSSKASLQDNLNKLFKEFNRYKNVEESKNIYKMYTEYMKEEITALSNSKDGDSEPSGSDGVDSPYTLLELKTMILEDRLEDWHDVIPYLNLPTIKFSEKGGPFLSVLNGYSPSNEIINRYKNCEHTEACECECIEEKYVYLGNDLWDYYINDVYITKAVIYINKLDNRIHFSPLTLDGVDVFN